MESARRCFVVAISKVEVFEGRKVCAEKYLVRGGKDEVVEKAKEKPGIKGLWWVVGQTG